jgi:hypothetical protein
MQYKFYDPRAKRDIVLHGTELVGVKSTPKPHSPGRFTEIQIFELEESGRFAVVVTGRSRLFHDGNKPCTRHGKPLGIKVPYEEIFMTDIACPKCNPAEFGDEGDFAYKEQDRSRVTICDNPQAVRFALEGEDPETHTRYLSGIGEEAWKLFADTQGIPETNVFEIR